MLLKKGRNLVAQKMRGNERTMQKMREGSKKQKVQIVSAVQFPVSERLTVDQVYDRRTGKPRHEVLRDHFIKVSIFDKS